MKRSITGFFTLALTLSCAAADAGMVDAKLIDMLLANGAITQAQHAELAADLAREDRIDFTDDAAKTEVAEMQAFRERAGWAAKTAFRGDMRVRNEYVNIEDEPKSGRDRDRQRIRARLGAFTQVNPEVEVGIQLATGNTFDKRSTNQDLDNYFDRKPIWLDLGYIDYHPTAAPGLRVYGGKMKQPWMAVGEILWDTDINPEGMVAQYQRAFGTTTLFGSGGYLVLKDNVDGDGVEWDNDLGVFEAQLGAVVAAGERARLTLGASLFDFNNDKQTFGAPTPPVVLLRANGNTTDRFSLVEGFSQLDVSGLPVPLAVYGQFVRNVAARDFGTFNDGDEDRAWLVGVRTRLAAIAFDYSYRDVEANGVAGSLTDSDFAAGYTSSSGHKLRAQYDIAQNFNFTMTWHHAESDAASRADPDDAEVETLMLDFNAKF